MREILPPPSDSNIRKRGDRAEGNLDRGGQYTPAEKDLSSAKHANTEEMLS
jgi:hypothetical protein